MKTSTAFAILAALAAGTGAVPISRRDDNECPCELLDPDNTVNNAHSTHQDTTDFLSQQAGNIDNGHPSKSYGNKPITVHVPQGAVLDEAAETIEPEDPSHAWDSANTFAGTGNSAFRAARPSRLAPNQAEESFGDEEDIMDGANITSALPIDETTEEPFENGGLGDSAADVPAAVGAAEDTGSQVGEAMEGDLKDPTEDEVEILQAEQQVSDVASDDEVDDGIETLANQTLANRPSLNNDVSDNNLDSAGRPVDQVITQTAGGNANDHVENLSVDTIDHTADTIAPVAEDRIDPVYKDSPPSSVPEIDMNLSVRPAQGQSASTQSSDQSSPSNGQAPPDAAGPITSGGSFANVLSGSGGSGLHIVNTLAKPQSSPKIFSDVDGLPAMGTFYQPQDSLSTVSGAGGLPVIHTLAQPQGTPLRTNTVNGLPLVSKLDQPKDTVPDLKDIDEDEIAPSSLRASGGRILASKVRPSTIDGTTGAVQNAPAILQAEPDGAVTEATDALAKGGNNACRECVEKAEGPATSRLSSVDSTVQSDPLRVRPAAESPESELPVSPKCATAPVTDMPANTHPCLINYGGRIGKEVDMCITQSQLASRPVHTMACPEEMQDHLGDTLSLGRRDDNDDDWDMLSRDVVQNYVRLCLVLNDL